ncbi:MAG: dockerin type I domain-containing protein [Ruminococcus sp.]|nr:dockerin type I domain-containing protein [Ruminococcus sp.]
MKKTAILLSALIAGALAAPTVAQAKNDYPVFRYWAEGIPYSELSDEEKLVYTEELAVWRARLTEGYVSGEYDLDFNLDGVVDPTDNLYILQYYAEKSMGTKRDAFLYRRKTYTITDEMRARVEEDGDITGDGCIDAKDSTNFLITITSAMKQGDVNGDGIVDARDASQVLAYYAATSVGKDDDSDYNTWVIMGSVGDVNSDGYVDAKDASFILSEYSANSTR